MSDADDTSRYLSHVESDSKGSHARMVDVSQKAASNRTATARATVRFPAGVLAPILAEGGPKGPIEEVARIAGILAAKDTGRLIPMCHPLALEHVEVSFDAVGDQLTITCRARCLGRTGVEMEAMTGASVAALTVYDMTKALTKGIVVERIELLEKTGGKSGSWRAPGFEGTD